MEKPDEEKCIPVMDPEEHSGGEVREGPWQRRP